MDRTGEIRAKTLFGNERRFNKMTNFLNIPFFNYPHVFKTDEADFMKIIADVGSRGAFIMQKDLVEFETRLAQYTGAKYAVGVANATDGLQIALMAGGIEAGDEVIISSHTMVATAGAIHFAGAVPVPVEAGEGLLIDIDAIEAAITDKTKAIMPTQLNGRTCDMDKVQTIADKHGLMVFEDAAQALGSKFNGRCAGTFGVASAISFYPAKTLGSFGDAGAVLTNDPEVYKNLLLLRDHGRDEETGEVVCWGMNTRMDNLQAAILNYQLDKYDQTVERRRHIAGIYNELLAEVRELQLPLGPNDNEAHYDIYQNYEVRAQRRDELKQYLKDNGIGTLVQWSGKAVHQFPKLGFTCELPKTDQLFKELLMIPLNMSVTDEEVAYVAQTIKNFYRG